MWTPLAFAGSDLPDLDDPLRTGARAPHDAAVVVGLSDYLFLPDVAFADRDATLVRDWLVSTRGVPSDRVRVLTAGSREQIVAAVEAAGRDTSEGGTVWLYFAGHGVASPQSGHRLLLGDDTRQAPEAFDARGVELDALSSLASASGARVVTWVDACFNGTGRDGQAVVSGTRFAVPDWVTGDREGQLSWAAAGPDQFARPLEGVRHGAFTWLSVGALRGWADGEIDGARDGIVTGAEATLFVDRALERIGLPDQDPVLVGDGAGWQLVAGATVRAPLLGEALLVGAPQPPAIGPARPPTLNADLADGWDPALVARADALSVHLPLHKGMLGYKDSDDERVRRAAFDQLVRATKYGRNGQRLLGAGVATTALGFVGAMATGAAALALEEEGLIPVVAGAGLVGVTGLGLVVVGQAHVENAVEPR